MRRKKLPKGYRPYEVYWDEINEVEEEEEVDDTMPVRLDIICFNCKDRVGYVLLNELEMPLRGDMIHHHLGCQDWYLPTKLERAQEFICPHAAHEEGDKHLFIPLENMKPEESSLLLTSEHKLFDVKSIIGDCPCGCGRLVPPGRKYADGLRCHNRIRQTEKEDA
jgi:hypothetical protein